MILSRGRSPIGPRLLVAAALATLVACASSAPRPGTGDISFRLVWSGVADLDLYAISPLGERLSFIRPEVESGGILDIDCNARPDPTLGIVDDGSWLCPHPIENIYWPKGNAPEGLYKYWMVVANPDSGEGEHEYRLEVRLGRSVVKSHQGSLAGLEATPFHSEFEFVRD